MLLWWCQPLLSRKIYIAHERTQTYPWIYLKILKDMHKNKSTLQFYSRLHHIANGLKCYVFAQIHAFDLNLILECTGDFCFILEILLTCCDAFREFVNSVWCIKILSPQEVQQMGKEGDELLNSVPMKRLSGGSCDDYMSRQDARNMSNRITSVGPLD